MGLTNEEEGEIMKQQSLREDKKLEIIQEKANIPKEYNVIYKFSDVIEPVTATSQEEAEKIANDRLEIDGADPVLDTTCYEIEVEEIEE